MAKDSPIAVAAGAAPLRVKPSVYPPMLAARVKGREKRPLGDLFGLTHFGVNLTRLAPGAASSLRHAHAKQDEFVYILQGTPTLHTNDGKLELSPGMCAGFKAGTGNAHTLINEASGDVVFLEIGDRTDGDEVSYPDDDLSARFVGGAWVMSRKDGMPIEGERSPEDDRKRRCAAGRFEQGDPTSSWIPRFGNGVIDFAYYEQRARKLRARWMRSWLHGVVDRVAAFWRRRATAAKLYALDERTLRDIGITRGDIPAIASGAFFQDETRRQRDVGSRASVGDQERGSSNGLRI